MGSRLEHDLKGYCIKSSNSSSFMIDKAQNPLDYGPPFDSMTSYRREYSTGFSLAASILAANAGPHKLSARVRAILAQGIGMFIPRNKASTAYQKAHIQSLLNGTTCYVRMSSYWMSSGFPMKR